MLQTDQLRYAYNKVSLDFPNLICTPEEPTLLIGPSGCGKTTLLQLITGLRKPLSGKVLLDGQNLHQLSAKELDSFRGSKIGIVFQQSAFIASLTLMEHLMLARSLAGLPQDKKLAHDLLESTKIAHKAEAKPYNLSVGEQQRFSIALALINQSRLIVADEPTSALDDYNAERVTELLVERARSFNSILIIVTHDQRLKAKISKSVSL